jgi:hypothetical protein
MVAAGCAAVAVVVALMLLPLGTRTDARSEEASPLTVTPPAAVPAPVVQAEPVAAVDEARPAPSVATPDGTADDLPGRDRRRSPELRAAADLCTDFARLRDAQELPALLERAARLLDASGLIVWIADPLGNKLAPTFAHGYPAHALTRLPAIARTADNATAAAFRNAQIEIVRTNGMSPGAIVVPLLAPGGCIGVVAAEVRHGREASETSRAVARILAAQMSTLLGTPTAQDHAQHAVG